MWILEKLKVKKIEEMLFDEAANKWLEYKKRSVKESTYYNYLFIVEKHLKPKYGNVSMNNITNYNDFIEELSEKFEPKTVKCIINILASIFKYFENEYGCRILQKSAVLPKLDKKKLTILNNKNKTKLEKYCLNENTLKSLGIIIALNTGLRIGELCALRWENIDFDEKVINVTKTLQRVYDSVSKKSSVVIDKPKTENSTRTIPMSKKLYDILYPLKKKNTNLVIFFFLELIIG